MCGKWRPQAPQGGSDARAHLALGERSLRGVQRPGGRRGVARGVTFRAHVEDAGARGEIAKQRGERFSVQQRGVDVGELTAGFIVTSRRQYSGGHHAGSAR